MDPAFSACRTMDSSCFSPHREVVSFLHCKTVQVQYFPQEHVLLIGNGELICKSNSYTKWCGEHSRVACCMVDMDMPQRWVV